MSLEEYRKSKSLDKLLGAIKEDDKPQVEKIMRRRKNVETRTR